MTIGGLEAVILAGGLGTRLRAIVGPVVPKAMAIVAERPFLDIGVPQDLERAQTLLRDFG